LYNQNISNIHNKGFLLLKTLLFIFIFALSLKAESLYNGKCVDNFYLSQATSSTNSPSLIYINYSNLSRSASTYSSSIITELVNNSNKFSYDSVTRRCNAILENSDLYYGLSEKDFNYSMAIYGIFLSSLIAFGLIKAF
jgi:hypothetical protein